MTEHRVLGRDAEMGVLQDLIDVLPEQGGALLVLGEAGMGKTTLLHACGERAVDQGILVLKTTGVQAEANLLFAGLHQLLHPVLDLIGRLPPPQQTALSVAFGMEDAPAPDLFLIALACLNVLAEAAESAPLLIIAEDAHWLDRPSLDALAFVARRVESERIAVLFALREEHDRGLAGSGLRELRLGGLNETAAESLVRRSAPDISPQLCAQVIATAAGNPLALIELPAAIVAESRAGASPLGAPLSLTRRLERAFAQEQSELPQDTRTALLVGAANDGDDVHEVISASRILTGAELTPDILFPAVSAGLIELERSHLRFRHPLVRSAIYQAADLAARQRAHAALADVLASGSDRQVWHRAAGIAGSDETVAHELEDLASRASGRGAVAVAVSALERSAELSESPLERGHRLLRAAELAFELGRRDLVERLLGEAQALALTGHQRAYLTWIRSSFTDGVVGEVSHVRALIESARVSEANGDTDLAMRLLVGGALRCWWTDPSDEGGERVVSAAADLGVPDDDARLCLIRALATPLQAAVPIIERLRNPSVTDNGDPYVPYLRGMSAFAVGDFELASTVLDGVDSQLRAHGRLALLAQVVTLRAWSASHLGNWTRAKSAADEAWRLAQETAQPIWAAGAQTAQALLAGVTGDEERAEDLMSEVEQLSVPNSLKSVLCAGAIARGVTALGAGRYDDAFERLHRIFDPHDPTYHPSDRIGGIAYFAEAAFQSGNREAGVRQLAQLEPLATKMPTIGVLVGLAYARAILADDDIAEGLFADALAGDIARWPFLRARTELAYGSWLRRQRRVADSRVPLRSARDTFDALRILPWGERARQELRASGETSRRRSKQAWDELTAQELQIAQMAAAGLSNREIGQQLYLSPRTVSSHLYRLFPKLGVTARGQLRDILSGAQLTVGSEAN
jgi:DNA-binding CsgD family transcriptional regulator